MINKFPFFRQHETSDCGPTCLRMVAKHYGKIIPIQKLRELCLNNKTGATLFSISGAAEEIGFRTIMAKISYRKLKEEAPLPAILYWQQKHFVVIYKITNKYVIIADPAFGVVKLTEKEFKSKWLNDPENPNALGVTLLIEPNYNFKEVYNTKSQEISFSFVFSYLKPHYKLLLQIFTGMVVGSLIQLLFPILTQLIFDKGINSNDINFVNLILGAQLVLLFSRMVMDFVQSRIFLFIGSKLSISLLSDFLIKLMKLPINFFETRTQGDILQRISDSGKIQSFLTGTSLNIIFSLFNLFLFGFILLSYNKNLFVVYFIGSILHALWIVLFLKKQREINFEVFSTSSNNQTNLIEIINGMQDIKLHNSERKKRWKWERIQAKSYELYQNSLNFSQYQQAGSFFLNETKNILITYYTVTAVMSGEITLGMMLAVQYIIGQLNGPIYTFIGLTSTIQDIKISIERLSDIFERDDELNSKILIAFPEDNQSIMLRNVSFQYGSANSPEVISDLSLSIPSGKITAVVGSSGSGKSTLMKLILGFYKPTKGEILIGNTKLSSIDLKKWREKCGAVTQDGYIFSDTILNNIIMEEDQSDFNKLKYACRLANIEEFIMELPFQYNTQIGSDGAGLSQGQKQRLLIARAIYKDPNYLFLDEATNSLDANNERTIVENLKEFFKFKTVLVIAHRLSTVMGADKIVVMDKGQIIEEGDHSQLIMKKGVYYNLVKNQLELSN